MIYDINKSFDENYHEGPFLNGPFFERIIPSKKEWQKLFDTPVMSRVGVAACPFTAHARGVRAASRLGFDIITWKTIRSAPSAPHAFPHVAYYHKEHNGIVEASDDPSPPIRALVNSIGNASYDLDTICSEINKARELLLEGQFLIVSIYPVGKTKKELLHDAALLAERIAACGVHAIELNGSCPNLDGEPYYYKSELLGEMVAVIQKKSQLPVIVKCGLFKNNMHLKQVMQAIAASGGRGISGINSVRKQVVTKKGKNYFPGRMYAGVSGDPIRGRALLWMQEVADYNKKEKLDLTLFGMGGITHPGHFDQFYAAGADSALSATGALYDPSLALLYHQEHYVKPDCEQNIRALKGSF